MSRTKKQTSDKFVPHTVLSLTGRGDGTRISKSFARSIRQEFSLRPTALKTLIGRKRLRREWAAERESPRQAIRFSVFFKFSQTFQEFFYFDSAPSSPTRTLFDTPQTIHRFSFFTLRVATSQCFQPSKHPPLYIFIRNHHTFALAYQPHAFATTLRTTFAIMLCRKPFALGNFTC